MWVWLCFGLQVDNLLEMSISAHDNPGLQQTIKSKSFGDLFI